MVSPEQGELKELIVRAEEDDTGWVERTPGAFMKMIWEDPETGASFALFKVGKGAGIPRSHIHASNQFMYCLKGRYIYTASDLVLTPGTFYWNPKDNPHGPTLAEEDSLLLEVYDGPHYYQEPEYMKGHQG